MQINDITHALGVYRRGATALLLGKKVAEVLITVPWLKNPSVHTQSCDVLARGQDQNKLIQYAPVEQKKVRLEFHIKFLTSLKVVSSEVQ